MIYYGILMVNRHHLKNDRRGNGFILIVRGILSINGLQPEIRRKKAANRKIHRRCILSREGCKSTATLERKEEGVSGLIKKWS